MSTVPWPIDSLQHFIEVASIVSMILSILACGQMIRNEMRRRARKSLKRLIARRHKAKPYEVEYVLARLAASAIEDKDARHLTQMHTIDILEDYIVDGEFRQRLYKMLIREFRLLRSSPDPSAVDEVLRAVHGWKNRAVELREMEMLLRDLETPSAQIQYLNWRDNYLQDKRDEMIEDVSDAIRAAAKFQRVERQVLAQG